MGKKKGGGYKGPGTAGPYGKDKYGEQKMQNFPVKLPSGKWVVKKPNSVNET